MLILRPHHLFCIKWFVGNGYSPEFTKNMYKIIEKLNKPQSQAIITLDSDDICLKCPNMTPNKICTAYEKVSCMDSKIIKYFSLSLGKPYKYSYLHNKIELSLTDKIIKEVCQDCQWFSLNLCWGMIKC